MAKKNVNENFLFPEKFQLYSFQGLFLVNDMHLLKCGQIEFLAQKDAQCSEAYEKQFSNFCDFYSFEKWSILYFFSQILLATRSNKMRFRRF